MSEQYSTVQAAKKLGVSMMTLHRYIVARKIPVPPMQRVGNVRVRLWSEREIERVRDLLSKIADGRKTRHRKKPKPQPTRKRKT